MQYILKCGNMLVRRDDMIKTKELAKKLGLHVNTIYNYIAKGMPHIKTDKDYLFDYDKVIKWLENYK